MTPRITIAINNYNYAAYVGEAIDSCLRQTYSNVQVVCVDDGSTDHSRVVISRYPTVTAIFQANGGQSSAARAAMAVAEGDVILFLDSDDRLHPLACERIAQVWTTETASVQFALQAFSEKARDCNHLLPGRPFVSDHLKYLLAKGRYPYAPTSGNAFSLAVARQIFDTCKIPDRMFFDACLVFCSPFFGKVGVIQEPLGDYRIHGQNISTTGGKKFTLGHDRFLENAVRNVAKTKGYNLDNIDFMGSQYWNKILKLHMIDPTTISLAEARKAASQLRSLTFKPTGQSLVSRLMNFSAATMFQLLPGGLSRLYRKAREYGLHRDFD